ncbi:uncharacterized protein AB675_3301 [Cyphellophora attinorum]|uniref:Uncharacterized protein n=1 Tax=Cyphellophora attinorum TaxID=1664694 RepID=A0A0N0NLZ7_9EURO|nr:uncharacterized protein AB675_3301 [Phialophora attinorum]KPI39619.1 hypothetical protein AB675_3301 [Phialophora attinorum]
MGLRDLIPALMLQLDLDQDCYDFIKWWEKVGEDSHYDWGDTDLPYLDIKDANIFEDVSWMKSKYGSVHQRTAMLLLKLKLLIDIINIKLTRKVTASRLPVELWRRAELDAIRSPVSKQWAGKPYQDLTATQQELEEQIKYTARYLQDSNQNFMQMLFEPEDYLGERPNAYSPGSYEEAQLALSYSYAAWWEHIGVLELLDSAKAIAGRDSESEIADMMKGETFKTHPGSDRTKEELLADVSRNRLWGYFDEAVEDALYLGEVKPSQVNQERRHALWEQAVAEEEAFNESDFDEEELDESDPGEDGFNA